MYGVAIGQFCRLHAESVMIQNCCQSNQRVRILAPLNKNVFPDGTYRARNQDLHVFFVSNERRLSDSCGSERRYSIVRGCSAFFPDTLFMQRVCVTCYIRKTTRNWEPGSFGDAASVRGRFAEAHVERKEHSRRPDAIMLICSRSQHNQQVRSSGDCSLASMRTGARPQDSCSRQ